MNTISTLGDRRIRNRYHVPKSAYDVVSDELENFGTDSTHLFKHVLIVGTLTPETSRWTYISGSLLEKELPGADPDALVDAGLLAEKEYLTGDNPCWRVEEDLALRFAACLTESPPESWYDLFSGEKTDWTYRSKKYDSNRNPRPPLIRKAMDALSQGYADKRGLKYHFSKANERISKLKGQADSRSWDLNIPWWPSDEDKVNASYLQWVRVMRAKDRLCRAALANQNPTSCNGSVFSYELGYRLEESGRLTQIGGGLQRCSPAMRRAAYSDIEGLHSYRIRSSIPTMLSHFTTEAGIDTPTLDAYLSQGQRLATARLIGIDARTLGAAVSALCVEPTLSDRPSSMREKLERLPKRFIKTYWLIFENLLQLKKEDYDPEEAHAEVDRFHRIMWSVFRRAREWWTHLRRDWIPENKYPGPGGYWLKNDVGCSIRVPEHLGTRDRMRRILAFLLHGREASFIHNLTVEADKQGVEVISNEHDGIVTIGELPDSAIQVAKKKTSLEQVEMVQPSHALPPYYERRASTIY